MGEQGWQLPSGSADPRFSGVDDARFSGRATTVVEPEPYATAPGPGGASTAPYDVAALPWSAAAEAAPAAGRTGGDAGDLGPFPGTEFVDLQATLGGGGYDGRPPRTDPVAVLALVVGLLGVFPWVGLGGIALGHIALWRLNRQPYLGGRGLALTGAIIGYLTVGTHLLIELFVETLRSFF